MRILIAEDEKDLNRLLKKRLEEHSYSVDACLDGEEALAFLEMTEYDAVILDIMMPKKMGCRFSVSFVQKEARFRYCC